MDRTAGHREGGRRRTPSRPSRLRETLSMPSLRAPSSLAATVVFACAALGATPSLADAACQTGAAGVRTSFVSVPPPRAGDFDQCYVVPDGVTHVTIIAIGAPG